MNGFSNNEQRKDNKKNKGKKEKHRITPIGYANIRAKRMAISTAPIVTSGLFVDYTYNIT